MGEGLHHAKYSWNLVIVGLLASLFVIDSAESQVSSNRSHIKHASLVKIDKSAVQQGAVLFRANGCYDCHSINGRGSCEGVSLSNIGLKRDRNFLNAQLKDPEEHVRKNKKAFDSEPNLMPNPNLSATEISLIVTYLQSLKKPVIEANHC